MIKTILSILAIIFTIVRIQAQGFNRQYPFAGGQGFSLSQHVTEAPNGNFVAIGLTMDTLSGAEFKRLTLIGTDNQGNLLWTKHYSDPAFRYLDHNTIKNNVAKDQSGFYYVSAVRGSNNNVHSLLIKCNYAGDTLWQKSFSSNQPGGYLAFTSIVKPVDGGLLISGAADDGIISVRTDINGNELWRKLLLSGSYSDFLYSQTISKIIQDTLTKKFIGLSNSKILVSDSLGTVLSETSYTNVIFRDLIQTQDKNFVAVGSYKYTHYGASMSPSPAYGTYAAKVNMSGSVLWTRSGSACGFSQLDAICEKHDGSLVVAEEKNCVFTMGYSYRITLLKLDNNGYTLKETDLIGKNENTIEYVSSMSLLADGGLILSDGRIDFSNTISPYLLVKVDSTFCDSTAAYCQLLSSIATVANEPAFNFDVFPNPADDVVSIQSDARAGEKMELKITNALGGILEQLNAEPGKQTRLDTRGYAVGIYFISLQQQGRVVGIKKLVIAR